MTRKYLVSPQGIEYREGKVYVNLSGKGYSDIFIFGKNQIVQYGVATGNVGGAVDVDIFEGKFKYAADGRADGQLKKISLFSVNTSNYFTDPDTSSQIRLGLLKPGSTLSNFSIGDVIESPATSGGGIRDLMKKFEEYRKFLKPLLAWEKSSGSFSVRDLLQADIKQLVQPSNDKLIAGKEAATPEFGHNNAKQDIITGGMTKVDTKNKNQRESTSSNKAGMRELGQNFNGKNIFDEESLTCESIFKIGQMQSTFHNTADDSGNSLPWLNLSDTRPLG